LKPQGKPTEFKLTSKENKTSKIARLSFGSEQNVKSAVTKENVEEFIKNYIAERQKRRRNFAMCGEPLVAFASAKDSLFPKLKDIVDIKHLLPSDLLMDAETVISYFIPIDEKIVRGNRKGENSSREWALSYLKLNKLIVELNKALSHMLKEKGFKSVATPPTHNFDEQKLVSLWSQKSVAFIAGLGKFGIHHMIITEKGCCGRLGSIVTNAILEPTKRKEEEFCLFKIDQSCGICVKNCFSGSLEKANSSKQECYKICLENAKLYAALGRADVCGKCISCVPCSFRIPRRIQVK
jgi:epoxyqueuosine reductase QueG